MLGGDLVSQDFYIIQTWSRKWACIFCCIICNSLLLLNPTENIPYHSGVIFLEYTVQIILQIQCRIHGKHSYVILDRFMYIIYRCVGYVWQLKKDTLQKKCQKRSNCNAVVLMYFSDYNILNRSMIMVRSEHLKKSKVKQSKQLQFTSNHVALDCFVLHCKKKIVKL